MNALVVEDIANDIISRRSYEQRTYEQLELWCQCRRCACTFTPHFIMQNNTLLLSQGDCELKGDRLIHKPNPINGTPRCGGLGVVISGQYTKRVRFALKQRQSPTCLPTITLCVLDDRRIADIEDLRDDGLSWSEIARELKLESANARQLLSRYTRNRRQNPTPGF